MIDDLRVAQVQEIWVDAWHWTGKASVRGGFELLPGREAVVGPARLKVASGELRRGETLAEGTHGEVWAELSRFSPQEYPGNDVWKIMTGGAELRAALGRFTFGELSGAGGAVTADVDVRKGSGSVRLDADVRQAALRTPTRVIRGAARLDLRAPRMDFVRWQASLSGSRLALSNVSVDGSERSAPWSTTLRASDARLSLNSGALAARIDGTVRDARPLVAMVPSGLGRWGAELLHLDGLRVSGNLRVAGNALDITSARGEAGNVTIDADYRKRGRSDRGAILVRKGLLKIAVELEDGKARVKPGLEEPPAITSFFRRVKDFFTD